MCVYVAVIAAVTVFAHSHIYINLQYMKLCIISHLVTCHRSCNQTYVQQMYFMPVEI